MLRGRKLAPRTAPQVLLLPLREQVGKRPALLEPLVRNSSEFEPTDRLTVPDVPSLSPVVLPRHSGLELCLKMGDQLLMGIRHGLVEGEGLLPATPTQNLMDTRGHRVVNAVLGALSASAAMLALLRLTSVWVLAGIPRLHVSQAVLSIRYGPTRLAKLLAPNTVTWLEWGRAAGAGLLPLRDLFARCSAPWPIRTVLTPPSKKVLGGTVRVETRGGRDLPAAGTELLILRSLDAAPLGKIGALTILAFAAQAISRVLSPGKSAGRSFEATLPTNLRGGRRLVFRTRHSGATRQRPALFAVGVSPVLAVAVHPESRSRQVAPTLGAMLHSIHGRRV
jgi:hypothetical protein